MSFNPSEMRSVTPAGGGSGSGSATFWTYRTEDSIEFVESPTYFLPFYENLVLGDIIEIRSFLSLNRADEVLNDYGKVYVTSKSPSGIILVESSGGGGGSGADGATATVAWIYQRTATSSPPASVPTANATYTFASGSLTGLTEGWSSTVPNVSAGGYLWVSQAPATSLTATAIIPAASWTTIALLAANGVDGSSGWGSGGGSGGGGTGDAGDLTGTVLAANVVTSSLTSYAGGSFGTAAHADATAFATAAQGAKADAAATAFNANLTGAVTAASATTFTVPAVTAGDTTSKAASTAFVGTAVSAEATLARSAANLTSGTIPAGRMPALTGDVTTVAGAVAATLAALSPSPAGAYGSTTLVPVITVDAKGRVTNVNTVAVTSTGVGGWGGAATTDPYLVRMTRAAATAAIANAGLTFVTGYTIEYTDPLAGGNKGTVCITAGIGGVATFKSFGVIAV